MRTGAVVHVLCVSRLRFARKMPMNYQPHGSGFSQEPHEYLLDIKGLQRHCSLTGVTEKEFFSLSHLLVARRKPLTGLDLALPSLGEYCSDIPPTTSSAH